MNCSFPLSSKTDWIKFSSVGIERAIFFLTSGTIITLKIKVSFHLYLENAENFNNFLITLPRWVLRVCDIGIYQTLCFFLYIRLWIIYDASFSFTAFMRFLKITSKKISSITRQGKFIYYVWYNMYIYYT